MARPDPQLLNAARYPFRHEISTRFADMDPNNHLNNVALAAMFEDGRVRFNQGSGFKRGMDGHRAMVASTEIAYLAEGHFPLPITVFCAVEALGGRVYAGVGNATHYHTDWVFPYWSPQLVKLARVETHLFFRWTGWWGTPPAFNRRPSPTEPVVSRSIAPSTPVDTPGLAPSTTRRRSPGDAHESKAKS